MYPIDLQCVIFTSMLGSPKRPLPSGEIIFMCINKLNRPLSFSTEAGKTVWQQKVKAGFSVSTFCLWIVDTILEQRERFSNSVNWYLGVWELTLSLLMSYIFMELLVKPGILMSTIWTYVWQRWKLSLSICCTVFQHWINAESYPVAQLCVNTLLANQGYPNYKWDLNL
jgi:hypothetical protein